MRTDEKWLPPASALSSDCFQDSKNPLKHATSFPAKGAKGVLRGVRGTATPRPLEVSFPEREQLRRRMARQRAAQLARNDWLTRQRSTNKAVSIICFRQDPSTLQLPVADQVQKAWKSKKIGLSPTKFQNPVYDSVGQSRCSIPAQKRNPSLIPRIHAD